jgi:hypothetical protein
VNAFTPAQLDEFVKHYLIAALWSSTDWRSQSDSPEYDPEHEGENMDDTYSWDEATPDTLAEARADALDFIRQATEAGIDLLDTVMFPARAGYSGIACHGHDLWLTRNGHGVGFWDRGYPEAIGDKLTDLAKGMGEHNAWPAGDSYMIE